MKSIQTFYIKAKASLGRKTQPVRTAYNKASAWAASRTLPARTATALHAQDYPSLVRLGKTLDAEVRQYFCTEKHEYVDLLLKITEALIVAGSEYHLVANGFAVAAGGEAYHRAGIVYPPSPDNQSHRAAGLILQTIKALTDIKPPEKHSSFGLILQTFKALTDKDPPESRLRHSVLWSTRGSDQEQQAAELWASFVKKEPDPRIRQEWIFVGKLCAGKNCQILSDAATALEQEEASRAIPKAPTSSREPFRRLFRRDR